MAALMRCITICTWFGIGPDVPTPPLGGSNTAHGITSEGGSHCAGVHVYRCMSVERPNSAHRSLCARSSNSALDAADLLIIIFCSVSICVTMLTSDVLIRPVVGMLEFAFWGQSPPTPFPEPA